jgi:hypothetical protein
MHLCQWAEYIQSTTLTLSKALIHLESNRRQKSFLNFSIFIARSDLALAALNGSLYINIHTEKNANGEIRGQIGGSYS